MKPGSAIFDLIVAHFEQNHTELSCLGTTYEVFGERAGAFTVFGLDEISSMRYILAHDCSFTEACMAVAKEVEDAIYKQLENSEQYHG